MNKEFNALLIAIIYFIFSFLWILFSEKLIYSFINNTELIGTLLDVKDWFFIIFTSIFIYLMVKRNLDKIQVSNNKNVRVINSLATPIIVFNEDNKVLMINKIFEDLTGYSINEISTIDKWLEKAYGQEAYEFKKIVKSLYDIDSVVDNGKHAIKTKEGDEIFWHFNSAPYGIVDGKKCVIASALDITELKDKEQLIIQQSKMAAMGEILENIAHQWRQPLSTISTASTGVKVQRDFGNLTDEILIESMDMINNSAQHLSKTIDDFRGFFKPNQKKEYFEISNTFEKVQIIIGSKFKEENIKFVKDIENFQILNYNNALIQVFINIFNNSKDAFGENDKKNKIIFIDVFNNEYNLIIQIKDTAGGIPSKIIDKIFEPYFTTKHQSHGTGIGLYMCDEIVRKHMQGKISVENKKFNYKKRTYTGAMFTITLPHTI